MLIFGLIWCVARVNDKVLLWCVDRVSSRMG